MSVTYNLEEAKARLPGAIQELEQVINVDLVNAQETARECAKQVGAKQVIDDVEAMCVCLEAERNLLKQMLGEEGDSVTTATLQGELASAKKMDATLNGI